VPVHTDRSCGRGPGARGGEPTDENAGPLPFSKKRSGDSVNMLPHPALSQLKNAPKASVVEMDGSAGQTVRFLSKSRRSKYPWRAEPPPKNSTREGSGNPPPFSCLVPAGPY